jgi:hypothetical protein
MNAEERATYVCPERGIECACRRKHPRPEVRDEAAERLFNGFANLIENQDDDYLRGYIKAMRDDFAEFARAAIRRTEMTTRVWYSRREGGHRYEFEIPANVDMARADDELLADVAQDCAADFHSERDGWEARWPLTLYLYASKDGPEVGRFEVDREYEPSFIARAAAPAKATP